MNVSYEGKDLSLIHINQDRGNLLFVAFSAWSPPGKEKPFGINFFKKNNLEVCFVLHKQRSMWWHTPEILEIAKIINENVSKKHVLYGSSMGGYAALHYRNLFQSKLSIAIAPQVFINRQYNPMETRWASDIEAIQEKFLFDEVENIRQQRSLCIAFTDPLHQLDSEHFRKLNSFVVNNFNSVEIINVPYSNHDVAKSLSNNGVLQELIIHINDGKLRLSDIKSACVNLFMRDEKLFLNFYRNSHYLTERDQNYLDKFLDIVKKVEKMDFEAQYMAAEVFHKLGMRREAELIIEHSLENYARRFKSCPPKYLLLKREAIQK